jgi:hypothetical protein
MTSPPTIIDSPTNINGFLPYLSTKNMGGIVTKKFQAPIICEAKE